jgi:recombinational DNA repair ATPase RecF
VVIESTLIHGKRGLGVDDALLDVVLERLDKVPLAEDAASLLLAACDSDASLSALLSGESHGAAERPAARVPIDPAGAYLRSVSVCGFRGVGPCSTLDLTPGPGLTLVVGRNGSGKSSFADGLEVLLTGGLMRWQELSAVWQDGWRNLHASGTVRISAELVVEDAGPATVERTWDGAAGFTGSRATVQAAGKKRAELGQLGWRDALVTYRPFLSHSELEAFFAGPSRLYDLLASVLGMEDLATAEARLSAARKERKAGIDEVNKDLPALIELLCSVDDERARSCRDALSGRKRNVGRALAVAAGGPAAATGSEIGRLRQLSQLQVPPRELADDIAAALGEAADLLDKTAGSEAGQALALASLLRSALDHYHVHGAGACPVCGSPAALDEAWRYRAELEVAGLNEQAAAARGARDEADSARNRARDVFLPVPAALTGPPVGTADPGPARAAWAVWVRQPDGDGAEGLRRLAEHIQQAWPSLSQTVMALVSAAESELRTREDRWVPVAAQVAAWCTRATAAEIAAQAVPALQAAITWLKNATDDIRNARLAPLGDQARVIWAELRQESNVDLGAIRLSGSGTRRQADLNVTVDGSPGAALGVMSQGEVNALALSIFLPRATVAASPFRFLVIDDPVQAMDPAKVEGLARVLENVARSRQVLVFTHDDRLPQAVRRLGIAAHILEVTRRPESVVQVRPALTPVERLLKDAGDLCLEEGLPENVAAQVVPGMCRLAVEASFTEAIRRRQLRAGKRHADVEAEIEAAATLTKRAALAMFGDASKGSDVMPRLNTWDREAADTYRALNKGAHEGYRGPLRSLVGQTKRLTETISSKLP